MIFAFPVVAGVCVAIANWVEGKRGDEIGPLLMLLGGTVVLMFPLVIAAVYLSGMATYGAIVTMFQ